MQTLSRRCNAFRYVFKSIAKTVHLPDTIFSMYLFGYNEAKDRQLDVS